MVMLMRGEQKMASIDERYVINVAKLMQIHTLPYPRKRRKISIIVNCDEWLPVIDGSTGKVVMV